MEEKTQLIPNTKLSSALALIDKEEKIDKETVSTLSNFIEKYINDILTRSAIITKHKERTIIDEEEIKFILEKEFDYFVPK